jgi:glutathione S-transferase
VADSYLFYGTRVSFFSAKVRCALLAKGLAYREIEPTPEVYRDVILARTGLAFIPVVVTPDDVALQDSSVILDELERRHPVPALYPATPVQRVVAHLFELYADEFAVLPAMHYRWSFPESEAQARRDFAAATGDAERAARFADRMQGSIRALGVVPESAPAIETHTRELLGLLSAHFDEQPYLFGGRPSLADCALMGPLFAHLFCDAVPGRLLRESAPRVCEWIARMNAAPSRQGDFLARDALAPTLRPLLELLGRDAAPVHLDDLRAAEAWALANPGAWDPPPRVLGMHETSLRGARFPRYTSAYAPWMIQRPGDVQRSQGAEARRSVEQALAGTGLEALLAAQTRVRAAKRGFQLVYSAA